MSSLRTQRNHDWSSRLPSALPVPVGWICVWTVLENRTKSSPTYVSDDPRTNPYDHRRIGDGAAIQRTLMTDHFLEGASVHTLARRYKLERRELEGMIEAALVTMRTALRSRGVRAVGDVI